MLEFCKNTFLWGDYIHEVWDTWYSDENGLLVVAEISSKDLDTGGQGDMTILQSGDNCYHHNEVVGVSHAYVCPNSKQLWVEGIRINPRYRRMGIASMLIYRMIQYGISVNSSIREAAAKTAETNTPSMRMLEKNYFQKRALWTYYTWSKVKSLTTDYRRLRICNQMDVTCASQSDVEEITSFLSTSKTFISGGRRHVQSWKWYVLDLQSSKISELIAKKKIILVRTKELHDIVGLAITNHIYDNDDNLSLQLVYLDTRAAALENLLAFIMDYVISSCRINSIQLFCPKQVYGDSYEFNEADVLAKFGISRLERFLLYTRRI
ncbi:MAG TPA: GNAT family N-acetyltransferase [Nitrososphaeraceae archaeon]|nr:GNAT family N-acetyltransferase [Nitrososphaeraceae archaeon]